MIEEVKEWSQSFYSPIKKLPQDFQDSVASLYLCLRAVDEIEDHEILKTNEKVELLTSVSEILQNSNFKDIESNLTLSFKKFNCLPSVTTNLIEYLKQAPSDLRNRISDTTSAMAIRMVPWVVNNWEIKTQQDFDQYFYAVAGTPGLMLCEIFQHYENLRPNRTLGVQFGKFLQVVNIIRGREEDLKRGVDFYPDDWTENNIIEYGFNISNDVYKFIDSLESESNSYAFCKEIADLALSVLIHKRKKKTIPFDGLNKP